MLKKDFIVKINMVLKSIIIFILLFYNYLYSYVPYPSPTEYIPQAFDVLNYSVSLDLTKVPSTETKGICTITLNWLEEPDTNCFYFNLQTLTVDSAFYNGQLVSAIEEDTSDPARFHYKIIPPPNSPKDTAIIIIYYHGTMNSEPGSKSWGGVHSTSTGVYSIGVGLYAKYVSTTCHWMPCFDHPFDKATFDGTFKVMRGKTVASNGNLIKYIRYDAYDIFEWKTSYPIATYLLTFAADDYEILNIDSLDIPVQIFSMPADTTASKFIFKKLPKMINVLEDKFGKYPFEKVGYDITSLPDGAMEHQTMISLSEQNLNHFYSSRDSLNSEVFHELSHQWFGDMVTCRDFRDAWLNEGFASYCETLLKENTGGKDAYLNELGIKLKNYLNSEFPVEGALSLYDFDRTQPDVNYPNTIYDKGALIIGMLRYKVGDSAFFIGVNNYLKEHAYSNVTTEDLKTALENSSGDSLTDYFQQWVYTKGFPILRVNINQYPSSKPDSSDAVISVRQVQQADYGIYKDVPIELVFKAGNTGLFSKIITLMSSVDTFCLNSIPKFTTVTINQGHTLRTLLKLDSMTVTSVPEFAKTNENNSIQVIPNPSDSKIQLIFNARQGLLKLVLNDIRGREILNEIYSTIEGKNDFILNTSDIPSGNYLLTIIQNEQTNSININIIH